MSVRLVRWLAMHFPLLPLEAAGLDPADSLLACAVAEPGAGGDRLLLVNACAAAAGVRPGLAPAAARALLPELRVVRRDVRQEQRVLEALAAWALQFSSQVSLALPDALVVEAGGSRRLFGGLDSLVGAMRHSLADMAHEARLAVAPTAAGSLLLVRAGCQVRVTGLDALRHHLAGIPLAALPVGRDRLASLHSAGLRHCGDLLAVPRAALGRRLGGDFLAWWARLLGEAPDPLAFFEPPAVFDAAVELPLAGETAGALLFPARRLLLMMEGFLRARQQAVQFLEWRLAHDEAPDTVFRLGFRTPLREAGSIFSLLQQRLNRLALTAPVRRLGLRATRLISWAGDAGRLLPDPADTRDHGFLDRVRARLGESAVAGLCLAADHRPERAMRVCPPGTQGPELNFPERPLWLLPEPRRLEVRAGRPWWHGPLQLEGERERIETGWWDGRPVRRDYFAARSAAGARLWVFLDHGQENRWFLHGFFG